MKWIDREKMVYKTIAHSHYGKWPRLEEITESYNLMKDIEDTYCKCVFNPIKETINKIEEEKKMKNIKWNARRIRYDHEDQEFVIELVGTLNGMIGVRNGLHDIADYVEGRLGCDNRVTTTYHPDRIIPEIKDVIFNGPATIVLWKDGTKTVVKAQEGEIIDYEKGMAMAIAKRMLGNKGSYYDTFTKYLPKEEVE